MNLVLLISLAESPKGVNKVVCLVLSSPPFSSHMNNQKPNPRQMVLLSFLFLEYCLESFPTFDTNTNDKLRKPADQFLVPPVVFQDGRLRHSIVIGVALSDWLEAGFAEVLVFREFPACHCVLMCVCLCMSVCVRESLSLCFVVCFMGFQHSC